ncbi:hypothetical protein C8F04DRAFT_1073269 [Mycena alexandri]|uniref:F-box domain-containing protein n=1 Tax=Mycena alexandri TaxID=1745969 RepID=A0AAD6TEQ1_9AGAR|nr:hypothetical protein C8F04DRAFT_1073269 [Mycena alexandri]
MSVLNANIALLESSTSLLEARNALDADIQMYESCLSPLRRMPPEILTLIFTFVSLPRGPTTQPAPWTVSAVCARWREIVISHPLFWTSIDLQSPCRTSLHVRRLKIQLRRSGDLPLDVAFSPLALFDKNLKAIDVELLQNLCEHSGRWGTLSLSGPRQLYLELKDLVRYPLALLREVEVRMRYKEDEDEDGSLDIFHDAPLLQKVVANKSHPESRLPLTMMLPYSQLVRYGGSSTWSGHLDLLGNASNLVDCALEIPRSGMPPTIPIHLPNLRRLSLSRPEFLKGLETPALLELYSPFASSLHRFLRRQSCKLRKLVVWEWSRTADASKLPRIIDAVPTVTELGLLIPLPIEFVHDFGANPAIAPLLECISTFSGTGVFTVDDDIFIQAIEERWAGGRLKSTKVYMDNRLEFPPSIRGRIELLRAQGMEFMASPSLGSLLNDVVPSEFQIQSLL